MSLSFNEFQRELQKRGVDERNAYIFTLIYERLIETEKMVLDGMNLLNLFATQLQGFMQLREFDQKDMNTIQKRLQGFGKVDGVEVHSVAPDPEDQ